jgi:hypothetical protein
LWENVPIFIFPFNFSFGKHSWITCALKRRFFAVSTKIPLEIKFILSHPYISDIFSALIHFRNSYFHFSLIIPFSVRHCDRHQTVASLLKAFEIFNYSESLKLIRNPTKNLTPTHLFHIKPYHDLPKYGLPKWDPTKLINMNKIIFIEKNIVI